MYEQPYTYLVTHEIPRELFHHNPVIILKVLDKLSHPIYDQEL